MSDTSKDLKALLQEYAIPVLKVTKQSPQTVEERDDTETIYSVRSMADLQREIGKRLASASPKSKA